MTRERAIRVLRHYLVRRERNLRTPLRRGKRWAVMEDAYGRYFVKKFIREIETGQDPVRAVQKTYYLLDNVLSESDDDRFGTHSECSRMLNIVGGILKDLHQEERMEGVKHEL